MTTRSDAELPVSKPSTAERPIQEATLDLIRWFIIILPRLHRHGLGHWLVANLCELLEQLALVRHQRERLPILEPLRGCVQRSAPLHCDGSSPLERPRSLPIGNLTSQFLANRHLIAQPASAWKPSWPPCGCGSTR